METRRCRVHRAATMAVIAVFAIATGASYLVPSTPTRLAQLEAIAWVPMPALGVAWVVAGVACLLSIPYRQLQPLAIAIVGSLTVAWAASFATSVILSDVTRSWVSAKNYAAIAALIALHATAPVRSGEVREVVVYDLGHEHDRDRRD